MRYRRASTRALPILGGPMSNVAMTTDRAGTRALPILGSPMPNVAMTTARGHAIPADLPTSRRSGDIVVYP
jgi:hypothetical protein